MVSLIYIEMCFFVFHIYATEYLYVSDLLNKKKRSWNIGISAHQKALPERQQGPNGIVGNPQRGANVEPGRRDDHPVGIPTCIIYIYYWHNQCYIIYIYIHISILLMKNAHCPQLPSSNDVAMAGTTNKLTTSASWSWTVKPMGILLKTHGKWEIFHSYVS